jgi:hypothetical protein
MQTKNYNFCLNEKRFDIPAKLLYIRWREQGLTSGFGIDCYLNHLKQWNGFKEKGWNGFEYTNERKSGPEEYMESFDAIINNIKNDKFDWDRSPIPIDEKGIIVNGAHRAAACLFFNKEPKLKLGKGVYFQYSRLTQSKYTDAMAIEHCRISKCKNLYLAIIYPVNQIDNRKLTDIFNRHSSIIYYKQFNLNKTGLKYLNKQTYTNEKWIGNYLNDFEPLKRRANRQHVENGIVRCFLLQSNSLNNVKQAKKEIRNICGVGNHSCHITDTPVECWNIANACLNDTSLNFLNMTNGFSKFKQFTSLFEQYKKLNHDENTCIDSSAVLSVYGIRDCRDIDFISMNATVKGTKSITLHNNNFEYYDINMFELMYNIGTHFYYDGVKFCSLDLVKKMKRNRGEKKDLQDIKLITFGDGKS